METIIKLWFEGGRIYIRTSDNKELSRPLEAFPMLKDATAEQRADFKIGKFGDDVRWPNIDEDIHISSFYDNNEPKYDNDIAAVFKHFPQLNVSEVARQMGMNKSLLSKYIYGIKTPSAERTAQIKETLRAIGKELAAIG